MTLLNNLYKTNAPRILLAEDNLADAELFSDMLKNVFKEQYHIVCVNRFAQISQALAENAIEVLILDMNLPDRSGVKNIQQLDQKYPMLPIIVLTGNEDLDLAIHSVQNGAQDYLSKNSVTPEILKRSVRYAKERKQIELKLKEALEDAAFKNEQLATQAHYDSLTNIANRSYFKDAAKRILSRAKRKNSQVALLYFDIDGFKNINDTYGHLVGDGLLQQVAKRLNKIVRASDLLARLGGDEFVIITDLLESKQDVQPLLKRIQKQFEAFFTIDSYDIKVSSSIGVAFYPEAKNLDILIKQADCAMYEAKANPLESVCIYSDKLAEHYARSEKIESCLTDAIKQNELTTMFQPVIDVQQAQAIYIEVLVRWHSPVLGYVPPDEFIAIAEDANLIDSITHTVVRQTSVLYKFLCDRGLMIERIFINISAKQLSNSKFCQQLLVWLEKYELPNNKVCLELTGRHVVQNISKCRQQFEWLRSHDIQISLDDFGKGFSSITHSFDLPFDILKLDRVLISNIDHNKRNQALVAGIVEMAHRLDIKVVAEGVERKEEQQLVTDLGCDFMQGYLLMKPISTKEIELFYNDKRSS